MIYIRCKAEHTRLYYGYVKIDYAMNSHYNHVRKKRNDAFFNILFRLL
jgi:hypothetical protein